MVSARAMKCFLVIGLVGLVSELAPIYSIVKICQCYCENNFNTANGVGVSGRLG